MDKKKQIVELDIRPLLKENKDPFEPLWNAVEDLKPQEKLILHSTFKPVPVLGTLNQRGFYYQAFQVTFGHWEIHIWEGKQNL